MISRPLTIVLGCLLSSAATAQDFESMQRANDLATILGSEQKCGFAFDQAAISAWIDKNVDPSDMGFAGTLSMMTQGMEFQFGGMSQSALTAHCRAVEQTAKHYGFLK